MTKNGKLEFLVWFRNTQLKLALVAANWYKQTQNKTFHDMAERFYERAFSLKKDIEKLELSTEK